MCENVERYPFFFKINQNNRTRVKIYFFLGFVKLQTSFDLLLGINFFKLISISKWSFFNKHLHFDQINKYFLFFLRILSILTHTHGRGRKVLKKLTAVYIQNGLTLGYIAHTLNLFNSHSFSNMGLTHYFFFFWILSILTHIRGEEKRS